ncbi:MAG: alpha-L-fucosidase [Phycisphaerales bacterium]
MVQLSLPWRGAGRSVALLLLLTAPVLAVSDPGEDWSDPGNLSPRPPEALGFPSRSADLDVLPGFIDPPPGYGEVPFWWWTGDPLDKDRLLWQIEELHRKGVTGMQINYAHEDSPGWPTYPVKPEIFSEGWWEIWNWIVGECRKRNMGIGLSGYTLDWPGKDNLFCRLLYRDAELNGIELALAQKVRAEAGEVLTLDIPADAIAIRAHRLAGDRVEPEGLDLADRVRDGKLQWTPGQDAWQVYVFCARVKPMTLNPLHPQAGREVVKRFFQPCEDRAPGSSSAGLNYFFQDELTFGVSGRIWTPGFNDEFRTRKGYDLLAVMAALFEDIGPITPKVRLDYEDVKVQLTEERYFRPIFDWHWQRGLIYGCDPGSRGLNPEEFGDYFRCVRWYTSPGHDTPGGQADLIKGKVSSSISHLYQRPRVWLEGYHSLGWGATPATLMKATCENYLYGCTLLNLHGLYYTTHGSFWEWAPPCYHFRMPYWDHMEVFLKYFERLSYLLSQGVHCCDVAMMYPVAPFQAGMGGAEATNVAFDTGRRLMAAGIDWDFMDFQSLARAQVRDGRLHVSGEAYRVLILPAMQATRWSTLQKAAEFRRAGGIVIAVGALPQASDRAGRDDAELNALVKDLFSGTGLVVGKPEEVPVQIEQLIGRDVQSTPPVMSLHRRVGDRDVFMVMGAAKGSECVFRAKGRPELWDPWTGGTCSLHVVSQNADGTTVRMPLEGYEAQVIVFSPGPVEPAGPDETGDAEAEYVVLDGPWEFELKPTLDNRWGDFRLPVDQTVIGPEARMFRYAEEHQSDPAWQTADFDDSRWPRVTAGFGPRFWKLGPLPAELDAASLDAKLAAMTCVDAAIPLEIGGKQYPWTPYAFSWRWGVEGDPGHQGYHGLKENVTDDFICLGKPTGGLNETLYTKEDAGTLYYLWTCAVVEKDAQAGVIAGGLEPAAIWLNGRMLQASEKTVSLKTGTNTLLLRYDKPGRGHFVLERLGASRPKERTPLAMSWYDRPGVVPFDVHGDETKPVGWYRFVAAPGLRAMTVRCHGVLQAWADGLPMQIEKQGESADGLVQYRAAAPQPIRDKTKVALRIEQQRGFYGGVALPEPVELECGPGLMSAGDWSQDGVLECYSGGAWYRRTLTLAQEQARSQVLLNLGDVAATAEVWVNGQVAGIRVTPPWVVDISQEVTSGENRIEILVYNTLANHYLTIPTRYRGSPRSGLIGPVRLEVRPVTTLPTRNRRAASDQHGVIGVAAAQASDPEPVASRDPWFPQAGLGMFIHWGLASIPGNLDLSWGMMKNTPWDAGAQNRNKLTPAAYFALAEQFNPTNYHPDRWLKAAREAGFGYAVLTTRHHDGFALWPSKHGDFNTRTYLGGRDLVREYVDACRRQGLKVGFYYSPPDWHFGRQYQSFGYGSKGTAESPHLGLNHEPVELPERPADFEDRYVAYVNGQIEELLTWYGRIDYLWFDGSAGPKVLSIEDIRKLQPGIIVNDRQHGRGDVVTSHYEYQLPGARPAGWWEHCFSMVGAWGYTKPERCDSANVLISKLAQVRTWGGNVLANFGPRPDGEMPDCFYRCMAEMKDWMDHSGTSFVGVQAGPYPDKCNVPVTVRGTTWFAHVLPKTADGPGPDGTIVLTGTGRPKRAILFATAKELAVGVHDDKFTIEVPSELRGESDNVVSIEW